MDNAIKYIGFPNTYPLDSDLSRGLCYPPFEQLGPQSLASKIKVMSNTSTISPSSAGFLDVGTPINTAKENKQADYRLTLSAQ